MTRDEPGSAIAPPPAAWTLRVLLAAAWRPLRSGWRELLVCNLLFQAAAFAVLAPLGNWLFARLISTTGRLAISNEQLAVFFLSPFGLLAAFLVITVVVAFDLVEQAGLGWIAAGDLHGRAPTARAALGRMVVLAPRLLALAIRQVAIALAGLAPLGALAGLAYLLFVRGHDIYFLVTERPAAFWWAVAIAVGLAALGAIWLIVLRIRWAFAMPICLLEGAPPRDCLRESAQRVRGHWWRIALVLFAWVAAVPVAAAVGLFVLRFVGDLVLAGAGDHLRWTLVVVSVLVFLHVVLVSAVAFLATAGYALLTVALYRGAGSPRIDRSAAEGPEPVRPRRHAVIAAAALLVAGLAVARVVAELVDVDRPVEVTAHRGSSARAPENTLSALRAAIEDRADSAEIDVQELADGAVVLFHDTDLKRIAGVDRKIWEVDLAEFRRHDVGGWFSPAFRGERVATLEQAIDVARGQIRLNIELKFHGHEKRLVERVVETIREKRFREGCVISSLRLDALETVRRLDPGLRIGSIVFDSVGDLTRLDVDFLSVRRERVDLALIRRARRRGLPVHVWTVNDPAAMAAFVDRRVDAILTDEPARLRAVLEERAELSDQERILLALRNWWWR
jgi:glycerophosphoryl diester phosphodiesterase